MAERVYVTVPQALETTTHPAEGDDTTKSVGAPEEGLFSSLRRPGGDSYVGQLEREQVQVDQSSFSVLDEHASRSLTVPAKDYGKQCQAKQGTSCPRLRKNERERVRFRRLKALMKDLGDSLPKTAPRSRLTEANVLSQAKQHMLDLTAEVARLSAENLQLKEWLDKTNNRLSEMMETERKRNESPRGDIQPTNAFIAPWESETLPDLASSPQCDRTSMSSNHISPTVPEEKYSHYLVPSPSLAERTPFYHVPAAEQDQSSPVFLSENNFSDMRTDSDIKRAAACLVLLSKQAHKLQDETGKTEST